MISARPVTAGQRQAAGDALGRGDQVRHDALVLAGEPVAGAAEAGLDLVGDEDDAVARRTTRPPRARKPGAGTMKPPSPWIGSMITAAVFASPTCACTSRHERVERLVGAVLRAGRPAERVGHRHAVDLAGERAEAVLVRHVLRGQRHRQVGAPVVGVVEGDDRRAARCACRAILIAFSTASAPELNSAERFSWSPGRQLVELLGDRDVPLVRRDHEAGVGERRRPARCTALDHPRRGVADRRSPRCPSRSRSAGCRRRRRRCRRRPARRRPAAWCRRRWRPRRLARVQSLERGPGISVASTRFCSTVMASYAFDDGDHVAFRMVSPG